MQGGFRPLAGHKLPQNGPGMIYNMRMHMLNYMHARMHAIKHLNAHMRMYAHMRAHT